MPPDLITAYIAAAGAIVGVVVGSVVSYLIAKKQIKATVVSASRQQWINTLRDNISDFQTRAKIATVEAKLASDDRSEFAANPEAHDEAMRTMRFVVNKVALLINPAESDHARLLSQMRELEVFCADGDPHDNARHDDLQASITSVGQQILKREWERVKSGK